MGDTAETNDADVPQPSAPWPDGDSWIDLAAVRGSILGCVDPTTGMVDKALLSKVEFQHNCRVTVGVLDAVPKGGVIGIRKTTWNFPHKTHVDGGTLYFVRGDAGRFSLRRDRSKSWAIKEIADAIALTMSATTVWAHGQGDYRAYHRTVRRLWEWSWMRVATIALADGPGTTSWTAERIDAMGAVLRVLVDICERRAGGRGSSLASGLDSSDKTRKLAEILRTKHDDGGVGGTYGADWNRVIDMERTLRGMLAWIDAMESTDVLFEHMLKHYQADRIAGMMHGDPRVASLSSDSA